MINSAINTNSIYCTLILGYLTSETLLKQEEVKYRHLAIVQFLKNINDYELEGTIGIFEKIDDWDNKTYQKFIVMYKHWDTVPEFAYYSLNKLKSFNMVDKFHQADGKLGFHVTGDSKYLWELIKNSGVIELINHKNL